MPSPEPQKHGEALGNAPHLPFRLDLDLKIPSDENDLKADYEVFVLVLEHDATRKGDNTEAVEGDANASKKAEDKFELDGAVYVFINNEGKDPFV